MQLGTSGATPKTNGVPIALAQAALHQALGGVRWGKLALLAEGLRELKMFEPPPETTAIRISNWDTGFICFARQWGAQELLRLEGFTDFRYVNITEADFRTADAANTQPGAEMCARGAANFTGINTAQLPPLWMQACRSLL